MGHNHSKAQATRSKEKVQVRSEEKQKGDMSEQKMLSLGRTGNPNQHLSPKTASLLPRVQNTKHVLISSALSLTHTHTLTQP